MWTGLGASRPHLQVGMRCLFSAAGVQRRLGGFCQAFCYWLAAGQPRAGVGLLSSECVRCVPDEEVERRDPPQPHPPPHKPSPPHKSTACSPPAPTQPQQWFRNSPKMVSKMVQKMVLKRSQNIPKWFKMVQKIQKMISKWLQNGPKMVPKCAPQKRSQNGPRIEFLEFPPEFEHEYTSKSKRKSKHESKRKV